MNEQQILEKAKQTKSVEELLAIAKENGVDLSVEEAQGYFAQLHKSGELADEELDNVAGGGCYNKAGRLVVSSSYSCGEFRCSRCGKATPGHRHAKEDGWYDVMRLCQYCAYMTIENGLWLCTNEVNRKG